MKDEEKTKEQLLTEMAALRRRTAELEVSTVRNRKTAEIMRATNSFLKNILDSSSSISIISTDLGANILFWNKGAENIFGYKAEEMVGKKKISVLYGDDEAKRVVNEINSSILETKEGMSCTISELTKDGRKLWIHLTLTPRFNEKGEIMGILGVGEDITEQVEAEETLRKSQEQLYQAQKMEALGALVAGAAHEINNPINLIIYNIPLFQKIWYDFLPLLKEHSSKAPKRKYGGLSVDFLEANFSQLLSDMDMAANRVAKIVSDLKNFSRQSNVADKRKIQVNTAVENAMRLAQATLRKSNICLELDLEPNLPLMDGNLQSIEQIILNIVINGVQAIDHDQGRIKIATRFQKSQGRIQVSIWDNGRGIDPASSDKIFDPFFTDKQAEGGTGLGLSVTYSLVKANDGEIHFQSRQGRETEFTVSFPAILEKEAARILIADDDKTIREMMAKVLSEERAYLVDEAANGVEACIRLGASHPHLLILDLLMPAMDGIEVCRAIRAEPDLSGMKVMVTTGFPNDPKVMEAVELGFTNIYYKPLSMPRFLEAVDNILNA